ncbi:hypothetical protein CC80DRAFT_591071 [Byssothecium circinans]|uniref:CCHC-type domain-containing protein n=1 Tax=Byssothecium circinans TaxID=147558 RepID=A0A6A5U4W3_9PLEO|nr:hypothetical protein CC80DRAFT_591071 [Byssothecium circinans]
MLHGSALMKARIEELEQQLAVVAKRKTRKRNSEPSGTVQNRKRARVEGEREVRQPGVRHCGNCGKAGHNARTCQVDEEGSSKSEASTQFIMSSSDADDNGDEVE